MEIILGALASVLVQFLKTYSKSKWATMAILVAVSIAIGFAYTMLVAAGVWETVVKTLIVAGAVHNFVLRHFE